MTRPPDSERPRQLGDWRGRGETTGEATGRSQSIRGSTVIPFQLPRHRRGLYTISERIAYWRVFGVDPYRPFAWRGGEHVYR
jgi:hypothetical protein